MQAVTSNISCENLGIYLRNEIHFRMIQVYLNFYDVILLFCLNLSMVMLYTMYCLFKSAARAKYVFTVCVNIFGISTKARNLTENDLLNILTSTFLGWLSI